MDGKTHLGAGLITGVSIAYARNKLGLYVGNDLLIVTGCCIGSLLPDIDIPGSIIGHLLLPISIPINSFFGHRTVTHSILFIGIVCLIGLLLKVPYSLNMGLFIGIATHLILDGLTPMGIPYLLYPFH